MKNTLGNAITLTLFGESHGPCIGAVLDGLAPGMPVDKEIIRKMLEKRRPAGDISTSRVEADEFEIVSGCFENRTTGTPLTILIPNKAMKSRDYDKTKDIARPGHADFTGRMKYHGYEDFRGGGHFSGRITAALTAAGAVFLPALLKKGIRIGTHISCLGEIKDAPFSGEEKDLEKEITDLDLKSFPVLNSEKEEDMRKEILKAKEQHDSVGGVLETAVSGLPSGLGEPWFDSLESGISHMIFSIPAVKGIEFGAGFDLVMGYGSVFNDPFYFNEKGEVRTKTNHNGGINGGISNGMPVIFRTAVKPTPSIFKAQETINMKTGQNTILTLEGRHDPAIIHRAAVVQTCAAAFVIADYLTIRYGTDYLTD